MKNVFKFLSHDVWFYIFSCTSIFLIVTSFFLPPTGVIDPSVFAGVGEIFAFAALHEVHIAIKKGYDAKIQRNDLTIEINNDEEK